MKRSTIVISLLVLVLLASNAWWAYSSIDAGVTRTYLNDSLTETQVALRQTLAILPVVAASPQDRTGIVEAARRSGDGGDTFEKDGYLWVGRLGLRFGSDGRLTKVVQNGAE